jgi:hypothetical protein
VRRIGPDGDEIDVHSREADSGSDMSSTSVLLCKCE